MSEKQFRIAESDMKQLVEHNGGCFATDRILVDGHSVGYMYREPPDNDADTGWRFMAGDESDEYMMDASNHGIYAVNTIANYDQDILPLIEAPFGSAFARDPSTGEFEAVESPVDPDDCLHPDFPVVSGACELSPQWGMALPAKFSQRMEDGALVFWRLGITIYVSAWENNVNESIDSRVASLKAGISPQAFDVNEEQLGTLTRFSYRLVEDGVNALYGFVVGNEGHLQLAIYFDYAKELDMARAIFSSVGENTN